MKYKIIKSDLFLNGKLIPENSEVDLSENETQGLEDYIIPIESERHTERSRSTSEDSSNTIEKTNSKRGNK